MREVTNGQDHSTTTSEQASQLTSHIRRGTADTPANCYPDSRDCACGTRGLRTREDGSCDDIADPSLHARSDTAY